MAVEVDFSRPLPGELREYRDMALAADLTGRRPHHVMREMIGSPQRLTGMNPSANAMIWLSSAATRVTDEAIVWAMYGADPSQTQTSLAPELCEIVTDRALAFQALGAELFEGDRPLRRVLVDNLLLPGERIAPELRAAAGQPGRDTDPLRRALKRYAYSAGVADNEWGVALTTLYANEAVLEQQRIAFGGALAHAAQIATRAGLRDMDDTLLGVGAYTKALHYNTRQQQGASIPGLLMDRSVFDAQLHSNFLGTTLKLLNGIVDRTGGKIDPAILRHADIARGVFHRHMRLLGVDASDDVVAEQLDRHLATEAERAEPEAAASDLQLSRENQATILAAMAENRLPYTARPDDIRQSPLSRVLVADSQIGVPKEVARRLTGILLSLKEQLSNANENPEAVAQELQTALASEASLQGLLRSAHSHPGGRGGVQSVPAALLDDVRALAERAEVLQRAMSDQPDVRGWLTPALRVITVSLEKLAADQEAKQ